MLIMMIDVESIGLHGGAYAVAWIVSDSVTGEAVESGCMSVDPATVPGTDEDRKWVRENVPPITITHRARSGMRQAFWDVWMRWKGVGAILTADCPWPVESRFLTDCIDDDVARTWQGPYPIMDVVSTRVGAGETMEQAMADGERLENELPKHHPLADCRQSTRLLLQALKGAGDAT